LVSRKCDDCTKLSAVRKIPELLTRGAPDEESLRGDRMSTGQVWIEMRAAWEGVSVESKLQKESAWRRLKLVGLGLGLYRLWWDPPGRQSSRKDHDWERAKQRVSASGGAPAELHKLAVEESAIWSEIREFLDARGIAWLDTLPALRDSLARGRSPYYTDVDSHFNELGNALVADLVARHPTVKRLSVDL
jgi:hypothetical protein